MKEFPALSRAIEGFTLWKSASGRSPNTIRDYKNYLSLFSRWAQDPSVDQVTPKLIEGYFNYLQNEHVVRHGSFTTDRRLSPKTISNVWIGFSVFWKWASTEYELPNPFRIPRIKAYSKPIHPLSMEEVEKLLKACDYAQERKPGNRSSYQAKRPTRKRDRAILLVLLDTGLRASELCNITTGDIDMEVGRIQVTGKGHKTRFVYMGKRSKQAVWSYLSERFPRENPKKDETLFVGQEGFHQLNRMALLNLLKRIGEKSGVMDTHPHRFRHTFAIEFLRNGGSVFTLQQLLGHSSLDMVQRYAEISQIDLEREHRKASPADNWRLR